MSRHDGVSCDNCMSQNFRGLRYKCLVCYDFDLCARCYESGNISGQQHTPDHAMQCILTRTDFDLYYAGENVSSDTPQSFTCPFCSRVGFTDSSLQVHVSTEHAEATNEVVCPVCAAMPGGDPNHMSPDLAAHLALDHVNAVTESTGLAGVGRGSSIAGSLEEGGGGTGGGARLPRRVPAVGSAIRGRGAHTARRSHLTSSGLAALSSASRDDSLAELLSQLGGMRRGNQAVSQLQQIQQALQLHGSERSMGRGVAPRKVFATAIDTGGGGVTRAEGAGIPGGVLLPGPSTNRESGDRESHARFLLNSVFDNNLSEPEREAVDIEQGRRSLFLQELLLATIDFDSELHQTDTSTPEAHTTPSVSPFQVTANKTSKPPPSDNAVSGNCGSPAPPLLRSAAVSASFSPAQTAATRSQSNTVISPPVSVARSVPRPTAPAAQYHTQNNVSSTVRITPPHQPAQHFVPVDYPAVILGPPVPHPERRRSPTPPASDLPD